MARRPRRGVVALLGGLVPALAVPSLQATAATPAGAPAAEGTGMVMVLDSSGSMAGAGLKRAVARVEPKGDTLIGLSLCKAAADLPRPSGGSIGKRTTMLLISDGEDTCRTPPPCKVAAQLASSGVDLHSNAIGFQVAGKARAQLECLAKAGNGQYCDAPDARSLARRLQRAGQLSADGYRFKGKRLRGAAQEGAAQEGATPLTSGVSWVPAQSGTGVCDKAGRYWLVVERKAARGSDVARWSMALTFHVEHPLKKGVTPAQSEPEYGAGGKDATLPTTGPKDVTGGTGFNDARTLHQGVWRDRSCPHRPFGTRSRSAGASSCATAWSSPTSHGPGRRRPYVLRRHPGLHTVPGAGRQRHH
ncbi:vWA domain-containing protein [Streptomyces platensis]